MNRHGVTPLTESGLLAALTVVLALAAVYLPIVGVVATLVWSLPIIVLVVRHGIRFGLMAVIVSTIIMSLLIEPMFAARMALSFAPTGLVIGYGFRKNWSAVKSFTVSLIAAVGGKALALILFFMLTAINPLDMQLELLKETFDETLNMYRTLGIMSEQDIKASAEQIKNGIALVAMLLPLVVILMGLLDAAISFILGAKVLKRLGVAVNHFPPFAEWRLPQWILLLFGFALVGLYWGSSHSIDVLYTVSINVVVLSIFAGLVEGLSLVHVLMQRYQVRLIFRVIIYTILLLNGVFMQLIAMTGLLDMYFDYRRRLARVKK